jgi:putative SOS response-associated peptidase YedK
MAPDIRCASGQRRRRSPSQALEPIHEKAMPVMLMTPDDVDQWLHGVSVEDALKMQKPAPDDAIMIRPPEKKAA